MSDGPEKRQAEYRQLEAAMDEEAETQERLADYERDEKQRLRDQLERLSRRGQRC